MKWVSIKNPILSPPRGGVLFISLLYAAALALYGGDAPATPQPENAQKTTVRKSEAKNRESNGKTASDRKLREIKKIIHDYLNSGEDLTDEDVQKAIIEDIQKKFPVKRDAKPKNVGPDEMSALVKKNIDRKYPYSFEAYAREQEKKAKEIYMTVKLSEQVTVEYTQGDQVYQASGVFYGITPGGKTITVGNTQVPIIDLLPQYKAKFYQRYCEEKRREYVMDHVREYRRMKNLYTSEITRKIQDAIREKNEQNGFVDVWDRWRRPENVAMIILRDLLAKKVKPKPGDRIDNIKAPKEEEAEDSGDSVDSSLTEETASVESERHEEVTGSDTRRGEASTAANDVKPVNVRVKQAKKLAEKKLEEIGLRYSGIDADQGYKAAIWGMPRETVCLLFHPKLDPDATKTGETEKLTFDSGFLRDVVFYFINDKLYKVESGFDISTPEAVVGIFGNIKARYGVSDEERALIRKNREEEEKAKEAAAAAAKKNREANGEKKEEKKKEEKKEEKKETDIPAQAVFTWSGAITKGVLELQYDQAGKKYTRFSLTKESTSIFQKEDAKNIQERRRKEMDEKRKQMEKARKFKDF